MPQLTLQQAFDLATQHHQAGRLPEAEQLYRQIINQQPQHAGALYCLAAIAHHRGQDDLAVDLIRRSIALRPGHAEMYCDLGNTLQRMGQLDEAIIAWRQAIALDPNSPDAHYHLANGLKEKGQLDWAIAAYRKVISLQPTHADAHCNLANTFIDKRQLHEAIAAYRQAIAAKPDHVIAQNNLGNALKETGQIAEAIAAYQKAIALSPNYAQAHNNLGGVFTDEGRFDEAITAIKNAISVAPDFAEAHYNLANLLKIKRQLDDAIVEYRKAIALKPHFPQAYSNLANSFKDAGQVDQALAAYRTAISLDSSLYQAHSNLVYVMHFHPDYDAKAIAEEHRRWNEQYAQPLRRLILPHSNDRDANRRLRIGYVSPDFREHVVGRNLLPLFNHHDRQKFEITCYSNVARPDAITRQFQQNADRWRNLASMSDEQAAEQIRQDRIDILVDLALHLSNHRLLIFARKPAPVQVTFAGYPGSTGLSAIDYRLSDPYLDPPGMDESIYSEKTVRLPDSFWCYDPSEDREIPVNPLPALQNGFITFGCLNNFCKINEPILGIWGQVLRQLPDSQLILLGQATSHRQRTLDRLDQQGINPQRILFVPHQSHPDYLQLYHRIDLGLDSFPYNGHTTSLDSFWMGVPVVTLVGPQAVSRAGWCQLSNLGLTELAANTPAQFVQIAVELAKDLPRLKELRATLRPRMEQSPLTDAPKFARNIEAAYRQMWQTWCEKTSAECKMQSAE